VTVQQEVSDAFDCFGSRCSLILLGDGDGETAKQAAVSARRQLLAWHDRFTRFEPISELTQLNVDQRTVVPVSAPMARFAEAVVEAAWMTNGLVDGTLLEEVQRAGYVSDLRTSLPLQMALRLAPARRPAGPRPQALWRSLTVDRKANTISRPPGVMLDSGGLAKGLFADMLGERLGSHAAYAIDCAGDLRLGGAGGVVRAINVSSPFDQSVLHTFERAQTGVATSGIGRRSWLGSDRKPAHHLIDPATGRPAFTGVVQVTALAPTALEAEIRTKAAILSGPGEAPRWLPDGGVVVFDDGSHIVLEPG
jgi:thiamine biosynthesis lipoprotein